VSPSRLVQAALDDSSVRRFIAGGPVTLIAAGKASEGMVRGLLDTSIGPFERGVAVGPGPGTLATPPIAWYAGGHPLPNRTSLDAGHEALRCAAEMSPSGCLVVLLSGGASALLAVPLEGVTLSQKIEATRVLLAAGVPIHELNCVRKHLSAIKGGWLARAGAGRVLTLAISDVVGPVEDDPAVIGSGPTVVDQTTFSEAAEIVGRPRVRALMPPGVIDILDRGREGHLPETLKASSPTLSETMYRVVGSRRQAMAGALSSARGLGYAVTMLENPVVGEARVAGADHPRLAAEATRHLTGPVCVVSSGETTVTVSGRGRGGRNQELALAAASEMSRFGTAAVLASVGTDGVDGPTDAAGAVVDSTTLSRAASLALASSGTYLTENDAHAYFDRLGDLIRTGPTGTNVGDLQVLVTAGR
jgi:hydroxypyruvate reductase